ncbi:hypothetical protein PoB_002231800 [Plakobranchus ocellatus]|uniref:Uncharacterized protein n=1 Tax=Plakobranchus ocellatus TaxID=259542 RepID=A0AAV3ZMX4_9GAST|nr:hypothetical protein PoB_002231800 [Plakobranchus ocellatus]
MSGPVVCCISNTDGARTGVVMVKDSTHAIRAKLWRFKRNLQGGSSPQQGDLRLSGPPSGQDAGGGARTRDRRVPADLRADSLATVPPTPPT